MTPRLLERYREEIVPRLKEEFGYENIHQVPMVTKVVVNMGLGDATQNSKLVDVAMGELAVITGQQPAVRRAKKSVSNFRLREGQAIGASVTLRRDRMWEFLDRLLNVALPRVRDFGGLSPKAFDGRGNYTMGVRDQKIFPEVDYDQVDEMRGMDIIVVTSANTDDEARELLAGFEFPFIKA